MLVVLVMFELALQVASPLVRGLLARDDAAPPADAAFTVLCVGDSNTYGLNLAEIYAYPSFLRSALQARFTGPVAVLNEGTPGWNSAKVAAELPEQMAGLDVDLVLILAGINDTWNTDAEGLDVLGWFKTVELARVLLAGVTTAQPHSGRNALRTDADGEFILTEGDVEERINVGGGLGGTRTGEPLRAAVRAGLTRAVETARLHGATPVLMTYAENQGEFAEVADVARALAAELDVLLVDHQQAFRGHFAERGYATLMFNDFHPNQAGYRLMALGVDAALEQAGLVPPRREQAAATPRAPPETPPSLSRTPDGRLRLDGPAGWAWQLLVCGPAPADTGFDVGAGLRVPLAADETLALSRLEPSFSGRFDGGGGPLSVALPPLLAPRAARACLLVLHDPSPWDEGTPPVAAVSAALDLRAP